MSNNEANLITNSEGAIYHLNLIPEDVCPVVITAGDPGRVNRIADHLDYKDKVVTHREFHTVTGILGSKRIMILSTGIGPDNIDIVMTELHSLYLRAVEKGYLADDGLKIIRMGTSGSVHHDYPLDSILVTNRAVGVDNLPRFYDTSTNCEFIQDVELPHYVITPEDRLWGFFEKMKTAKTGITLTCPGFYGPQSRKVHLPPRWTLSHLTGYFRDRGIQISNIEMETAAIYFFAAALRHQAVSINALIAHRLTNKFSENPDRVVRKMIGEAMEVIREMPVRPNTLTS